VEDSQLRDLFASLPVPARDVLRRAARADQRERDALSARLMREPNGRLMADLIDELSINAEARRQTVRVLGDLEASHG